MVVHVAKADLSLVPVDAVVVPTSGSGIMDGRSAAALKERGGEIIEQEARAYAPIAIGAAVITSPGALYCKHVIHVPVVDDSAEARAEIENARRATRAALIAAAAHGFDMIAMPGIGTGKGGLARDEVARAMCDELRIHKAPKPMTVYLVDLSDLMIFYFEEALRNIQSPHTGT